MAQTTCRPCPDHTPAAREKRSALGALVASDAQATPQYLAQFVKSETEKWAGPIKASGMQVD